MLPEKEIAKLLIAKRITLAAAESCTGGLLSHRLTNIPGSSKYFILGIVTYSNQSKISLLKIPEQTIKKFGAVSKKTSLVMARNIRKLANTDIGIGITGIAGPTGTTKTKPIGLVFIALSFNHETIYKKFNFTGSRLQIKAKAANEALKLILNNLKLICSS